MHTVLCSKHNVQAVSVNTKLECIRCVMEERDALLLQIDLLKKALYAECTGQACNPDDCYQGYRQCTGCEIRAKKAYGEGWGK